MAGRPKGGSGTVEDSAGKSYTFSLAGKPKASLVLRQQNSWPHCSIALLGIREKMFSYIEETPAAALASQDAIVAILKPLHISGA